MRKPGARAVVTIEGHQFTIMDLARVRKGVAKARCRHCNGYARILSGRTGRPHLGASQCADCQKTQARLRVLEEHMLKEGML